jgi:hypothetical protein
MGLDMYLNAKRYFWHNEDARRQIAELLPELGDREVKEVTAEAAYWRKSNAIHKWFVDNVQNGVDDCGNYEVSREALAELLEIVNQVLVNRGKAGALLPTQAGFFFGDTQYDQYYFDDLEYTKNTLTDLLDSKWKGWDFEYHSSW